YEFGELTAISTGPTGNSTCPLGTVIKPSCDTGTNGSPTLQSDGTISNISSKKVTNTNFTGDYPYFMETSIDPRIAAPTRPTLTATTPLTITRLSLRTTGRSLPA